MTTMTIHVEDDFAEALRAHARAVGTSVNRAVKEMLSPLDVITEVNGWIVCIANNKLGYIRGDLVNISLFPAPADEERPIGTASVKAGVLDAQLRIGPSEYSGAIITLYPGVNMQVWHRIGNWYHVRFAGRYAYIHASKITAPVWNYSKITPEHDINKLF